MTPLEARIPITAFVVTDFPEPDSPTIAIVSPSCKSRSTPRTALTSPLSVLNDISKSRIFKIFFFSSSRAPFYISFIFGSNASRNPSASKLKESIKIPRITTGITTWYGVTRIVLKPSLIKEPREACGAGIPRPTMAKKAS